MKEEDKILNKYGRDTGFSVPEGYFEQVFKTTLANLPEQEAPGKEVKISAWHRVRPYLYMAAMFAGIWLMMKLFYNFTPMGDLNFDNPPEQIAMALQVNDIQDEIFMIPSMDDYLIEHEVCEQYTSIEDFERDFGDSSLEDDSNDY